MATSLLILALASTFAHVIADNDPIQQYNWYEDFGLTPEQWCFNGCYTVLDLITFNFTPPGSPSDYYINSCSNTLQIKSLFYCSQKYCTYEETVSGRHQLNSKCVINADISLPSVDSFLLSESELDALPLVNETAGLVSVDNTFNTPVLVTQDWFELGYLTLKDFYTTWNVGFDFAFASIAFWGLVLAIGMVHRIALLSRKSPGSGEASWWLWIRKNLILPATFRQHQSEAVAWTCTIPPRLETAILIIYAIMNFIFCFPAYHLMAAGNQYYATSGLQLARYIADRTGFLSFAQLPMVWVFAARNDPFLWLTGWSYATYSRFHRWIARIMVVHAVIHSIAYTVFDYYSDPTGATYRSDWSEQYWYCGEIATIVCSLMLVVSGYWFRQKLYDLFVLVHVGLSLVLIITLWYHVRIFSGEFNYFLYPCIAMWSLDRIIRVGRTVFVSIMPRFTNGVRAIATYHEDTDLVRLDITEFMPEKQIVPGLYYFLYMPAGLRGHENHPFTLCSWRRPEAVESSLRTLALDEKEANTSIRPINSAGEVAHTMLIRPYDGATGRLRQKPSIASESAASTQLTVFLEGPYGQKLDLSSYSDALFVCGGAGITAAISHTHFLVAANSTTQVHIAWAVPQRHLPDDICANELASVIQTDRVDMTVYLTSDAEAEAVEDPEKLPAQPPYELQFGRPDVEAVMREHRAKARKSLAVVTCGTPQMSDMCRMAIVRVLGEEGVEVGYYNETLMW